MTSNAENIEKIIKQFDEDVNKIKGECLKLSWYMRGGITYAQAMALRWDERTFISVLIKENLETTKKSGLPFF